MLLFYFLEFLFLFESRHFLSLRVLNQDLIPILLICRMLLAFSEQTKGQKLPDNATDQEMLEIVMARWVCFGCVK